MSESALITSFCLACGMIGSHLSWRLIRSLPIPTGNDDKAITALMPLRGILAVLIILGGGALLALSARRLGPRTAWESGILAYGIAYLWYLTALFERLVVNHQFRLALSTATRGLRAILMILVTVAAVAAIPTLFQEDGRIVLPILVLAAGIIAAGVGATMGPVPRPSA